MYLSVHDVEDFLCQVLSCFGFPTGNNLFRIFFFFLVYVGSFEVHFLGCWLFWIFF